MRMWIGRAVVCLLCLCFLSSCAFSGPRIIRSARYPYNESLIKTWNEQLLLNLIRLRYRDTPYFLEVSSVSTQYKFSSGAGIGADIDVKSGDKTNLGADASLNFEERPTITYSPLQGEKFAKQIMSSIPLETLLLLINSGWSIDRVIRACVSRMNSVNNAPTATGPTPELEPDYREFKTLGKLLRELQDDNQLATGVISIKGEPRVVLHFAGDAKDTSKAGKVFSMLGLSTKAIGNIPITNNPLYSAPNRITMVTRSLLGVMFYLSQGVQVPSKHQQSGRVTITRARSGKRPFDWSNVLGDLLHIHSSIEEPKESFVKIRYRDYWFYVDDKDLNSKSTFMLLAQLFWLQAGDIRSVEPALTLPLS